MALRVDPLFLLVFLFIGLLLVGYFRAVLALICCLRFVFKCVLFSDT